MHGYIDHDQEQPIGCCWLFTFAKLLILFGITKFFLSFLMNNPKELDSETGHLYGIGERVDLSRFMNGTTIKDLML